MQLDVTWLYDDFEGSCNVDAAAHDNVQGKVPNDATLLSWSKLQTLKIPKQL